jgi:hypothetical protein
VTISRAEQHAARVGGSASVTRGGERGAMIGKTACELAHQDMATTTFGRATMLLASDHELVVSGIG